MHCGAFTCVISHMSYRLYRQVYCIYNLHRLWSTTFAILCIWQQQRMSRCGVH